MTPHHINPSTIHIHKPDQAAILAVRGFRAHGVHAGIKKARRDVCLIVSDGPAVGAGVFTQSAFAAAPVQISRAHVATGDVRAIVCNAGNANACTGDKGLADAMRMADLSAALLNLEPQQIAVCSTGIIGTPLDMTKVEAGIYGAAAGLANPDASTAAEAILTTDSGVKATTYDIHAGARTFRVAGIAKGSGMIHPNMATMLGFLITDAPVGHEDLQDALTAATGVSYNMITVDGDTSTNDTVLVLANGAEGGAALTPDAPEWAAFQAGLNAACIDLAKQIAADGEGAGKLMEVTVTGAKSEQAARRAARTVAGSNLVKAAVHGGDPNWGRIVAALGRAEADVDPHKVTVSFGVGAQAVTVVEGGEPCDGAKKAAALQLTGTEVVISISLGSGQAAATAWGCDLSPEYVTFNSAYTT